MQKITPCLWFDDNAEEAVKFYTSIFKNSKTKTVTRYGEAGHEIHGKPAGTVLTIAFEIEGHEFTALNGGPEFKFNEAISLAVNCQTQEEVDYYWEKLSKGGDERAQQCGWLKDKFGVSWQVVPTVIFEMLADRNPAKSERVMTALLQMKKLDIEALKRAYEGREPSFRHDLRPSLPVSKETSRCVQRPNRDPPRSTNTLRP
jgi:predicted 3-demethylubiquinone-9 3-methyltransferase (glyoxalase superfamily)